MACTQKAEPAVLSGPRARMLQASGFAVAHAGKRPASFLAVAALLSGIPASWFFPVHSPLYLAALAVAVLTLVLREAAAEDAEAAHRTEELVEARRQAKDASRAKSRFLAMVSHEVRTPLNGILGTTHLLERTPLSAEQECYVAAIRRSGGALHDLVADLLDFSAIEAGRLAMRADPVDLGRLAEDVVELMAPRAHGKGLDIATAFRANAPCCITADENRLRQVLFNLMGNAVKFTETGGLTLIVDREEDMLVLTVADTGPGLPLADRQRIFEEFEQAGGDRAGRTGGVGLGLAISRRIVAAMGGTIDLECPACGGSRFTTRLPLREEDRPLGRSRLLAGRRVLVLSPRRQTGQALCVSIAGQGGAARHSEALPNDIAAFCRSESITDIIVDHALSEPDRAALARLPVLADGGPRHFLLVRPEERAALDRLEEDGYDGWLVAPVRRASLLAALRGEFALAPSAGSAHPDLDRIGAAPKASRLLDVLVAEDNPVNALLITNVLRKEGHAVTLVEDGQSLTAAACGTVDGLWPFDLVITDLSMPVMEGGEAIARIRAHQRKEALTHMPVIVLSADGQLASREEARRLGADLYLEKPVDPAALLGIVARFAS